jgi:hypothetical protein
MEKIKSTVKLLRNWLEQWSPQLFMVFLLVVLMGSIGWVVQDNRAGHQELQSAAIVEKIYRRAVDDEILVPIDSSGTMMTIDTSTPARFIIKLALDNKTVEQVRVKQPQFESLDVGESVKFKRWVGRSGKVYRQSILVDSSS